MNAYVRLGLAAVLIAVASGGVPKVRLPQVVLPSSVDSPSDTMKTNVLLLHERKQHQINNLFLILKKLK